jgi:molybdopterin-guanine dinucleotide biosynthesis protein A
MTLTAVLFAGGESRRMGVEKATLSVGGSPLWCRQLETLRRLQPQALWISARSRPVWCPAEMEVLLDQPPSRGPLTGLVAALTQARTSHVLALAVDLPDMTAEHLATLSAAAQPGRGVVPLNGTLFEPLCAIYPIEAAATAQLAGGDASLQRLVRSLISEDRLSPHVVTEAEKSLYRNLNTPADLSEFARGNRGDSRSDAANGG